MKRIRVFPLHVLLGFSGLMSLPATALARSKKSSISGDPGGHTNRGVKYAKARKYNQAIEEFAKAIEAQPKDPKNYQNRALCYRVSEKLDEAKSDYGKIIDRNSKAADAYASRGRIELGQKEIKPALKDSDQALEKAAKTFAHSGSARGAARARKKHAPGSHSNETVAGPECFPPARA